MSSDYGPAQWIPTDHYWAGRGGHTPRWIVIHGSAGGGSAQEIARFFQSNDPPTSTHYVIGRDGAVAQCVAEADSAWGNGVVTAGADSWWSSRLNPNFVTISIEHVKSDPNNINSLTAAQKQASFALIKRLCAVYNIPARQGDANGGIVGHNSIDPVNRAFCPGPYPWDELWAFLAGGAGAPGNAPVGSATATGATRVSSAAASPATSGVPLGWRDDGTRLTAPNGQSVTAAFRAYILRNAWDPANVPLEAEHTENPYDITNPQSGAGTVQTFRDCALSRGANSNQVTELSTGALALAWRQRATLGGQVSAQTGGQMASQMGVQAGGQLNSQMGNQTGNQAGGQTGGAPPVYSTPAYLTPTYSTAATSAPAYSPSTGSSSTLGTAPMGGAVMDGARGDGPSASTGATAMAPLPAASRGGAQPARKANVAVAVAQRPEAGPVDLAQVGMEVFGDRLSGVEKQLQTILDQLAANPTVNAGVRIVEREVKSELSNPQEAAKLLGKSHSVLRWILMLIGLILSDVIAWIISTFVHHVTPLPFPFLTAGTMLASSLIFLATFRARLRL